MIYISVEMGNAAFEDAGEMNELARILRGAADRIEGGDLEFPLRDVNGNRVGAVSETPRRERDVRIQLETDNAAFVDGNLPPEAALIVRNHEAARIIREAAAALESGRRSFPLRDVNGNRVGSVEVVRAPAAQLDDGPSP